MLAGRKAGFSFCMPVACNGPSPSMVMHSLGYLGSVSIPFSSSVQGFSSRGIAIAPPPPPPHTHNFHIYTGVTRKAL